MAVLGYATGGASGLGPSDMFSVLPWKNWRELGTWVEEFIDAAGIEIDIRNSRFIKPAARANLLDPTYTPTEAADPNLATATSAPTTAVSQDTMLDVLAYIALGVYPLDSNLSIAQKQALVQVGWSALRRKGNRLQLLNLISKITDGVVYGWTNPPYTFSFILPDGAPSPGYGSWAPGFTAPHTGTVAVTNGSAAVVGTGTAFLTDTFIGDRFTVDKTTIYVVTGIADNTHLTLAQVYAGSTLSGLSYYSGTSSPYRAWILNTIRNLATPLFPGWSQMGVGFSQFRAGYSSAGETVMPSGARLNVLQNEHFSSWTAGTPDSWTKTGSGTLTQSASATAINAEFSNYAAVIDLTAATAGTALFLSQSTAAVNNQITHRFQLDYSYSTSTSKSVLVAQITDLNANGSTYYWNPTTATWGTAVYSIPLAPSTTRGRFACDVVPQAASATTTVRGTSAIKVAIGVTSDGTATTQTAFTLYRAGVYEKYTLALEQAAVGERSLWLPLVDAPGWTTFTRTAASGALIIEPSNADRSKYKTASDSLAAFDYHPALSGRGYRSSTAWTNLIKGSNEFFIDWTRVNVTMTGAGGFVSPLVGETSAAKTANGLFVNAVGGSFSQAAIVADPHGKTYCGGIWLKKTEADANQAGTITVTSGSATVTGSGTAFDASWVGADIKTAAGYLYRVSAVGGATSLTLAAVATRTETATAFSISDVILSLNSTSSYYEPYFLVGGQDANSGDGWKLLTVKKTMAGGDVAALSFKLTFPATGNGFEGVASSYLYDVTGKTGVLYPPVCQTPVGATASVGAGTLQVITSSTGSDMLHPLIKRTLVSVARGVLSLRITPTFDASSQPDSFIFDVAESAVVDRITLKIISGALQFKLTDSGARTTTANLTMTTSADPAAGQVTWRRDVSLLVQVRWNDDGSISMSAGSANVTSAAQSPWTPSNAAVVGAFVGASRSSLQQFDGVIRDLEVVQVGAPTT